ncbi:ABC transporter ATP-binding protein [Chryseobacterium sp.]|uniref:ABC transporter ATP-binding protein n=1 Tax=Chryseobacterium sp. TaxID=1871047 RepID=UPI002896AAEB|nr:ABC transporter ATP-binding protein [Chryseobacterium sp.]
MLALKAENISKQYRLGQVGTGTLTHDLNRFWHKVRGKEDPYLKIGEANDRSSKGSSDYVWSLRDINFEIEQGDAVGIIGRNGAGKSTLLKILSKVTKPTTGKLYTNGRIASLLEVGTGFHPEMTGRENIFLNGAILGMTKKEITRKFDEIVDFSGVERYIDTPVKRYSSGMYVRLAFAVAAHLESEILIVDEVLAVGDAEFQKKCLGKMGDVSKGEGRTILFVSHNMAAIKKLCTKGILLENGRVLENGNIENVITTYSRTNKNNIFRKDEGFVREIYVDQQDDKLLISCYFESLFEIKGPSFGFVISDLEGNKLFGTNPYLSMAETRDFPIMKSGKITAYINNPKLLNGSYVLSVWFGSENEDYEELEEIIEFEVINMIPEGKRINYKNAAGPIFTETQFNFN